MYKLSDDENFIIRLSDGAWIPKDERNHDYQEYLEYLKQKGTKE